MNKSPAVVFMVVLCLTSRLIQACTTFAIGKKATADGSVMAAHTNDGGSNTDPRLVRIPAQEWEEGSFRPIYASPEDYPRYTGYDRGAEAYYPENCAHNTVKCSAFTPIGYIPQVRHTYAYFEETYGAMNEKQVGIVESTCSGVFVASSVAAGGKALLSVDELSKIALERATSSREAVSIMGALAEEYGFYGESTSFEGGSESLFVTDPDEAWSFHILADPTGSSAIWVAARVPDDSISVTANMFSIREVDLTDTDNYLGRSDMWELAAEYGLYTEGDVKDFTLTFSDGEYSHKYYSGRRMWGVYRKLAASANLEPEYDNLKLSKPYPFAAVVDSPVTPADLMAVLREWYAGTDYSTGAPDAVLAGGAYGTPDRFGGSTGGVSGNWERTIALYRTSDSYIVQSRSWLPDEVGGVLWYGPLSAHMTVYTPLMVSMTQSPDSLQYGWQGSYNLTTSFWANRNIQNIAQMKYSYILADVQDIQSQLETASQYLVNNISTKYTSTKIFSNEDKEEITTLLTANVEVAKQTFLDLLHSILFKYADGYVNFWSTSGKLQISSFFSASTGYPAWWLEAVDFASGPPPVSSTSLSAEAMQQYQLKESQHEEAYKYELSSPSSTLSLISKQERDKANNNGLSTHTLFNGYPNLRSCINVGCDTVMNDVMYQNCVEKCTQSF